MVLISFQFFFGSVLNTLIREERVEMKSEERGEKEERKQSERRKKKREKEITFLQFCQKYHIFQIFSQKSHIKNIS